MAHRAPSKINVSIDRLTLNGFAGVQQAPIAAQLQAELSRLLGDPSIAAEIARSRYLPILPIPAASPNPAAPVPAGIQAAASIVRGLRG